MKRHGIPQEGRLPRLVAATAAAALLLAGHARAGDLSGSAALTTDYVWRGSTQSDGGPAAQAGFKLAADSGFYGSVWGSSVDFPAVPDASTELDITLGWGRSLGENWAVDANVLRYVYPGTQGLDWNEVNATATYRQSVWLGVGHSTNALALHDRGTYAQVGGKHAFGERFRVEGGIAHYALGGAAVDGYSHAWASGVWTLRGATELRATLHDTDDRARALFGDDFAGRRVELALQTSF